MEVSPVVHALLASVMAKVMCLEKQAEVIMNNLDKLGNRMKMLRAMSPHLAQNLQAFTEGIGHSRARVSKKTSEVKMLLSELKAPKSLEDKFDQPSTAASATHG